MVFERWRAAKKSLPKQTNTQTNKQTQTNTQTNTQTRTPARPTARARATETARAQQLALEVQNSRNAEKEALAKLAAAKAALEAEQQLAAKRANQVNELALQISGLQVRAGCFFLGVTWWLGW
jgi:hypothetical protein